MFDPFWKVLNIKKLNAEPEKWNNKNLKHCCFLQLYTWGFYAFWELDLADTEDSLN